MDQNNENQAAPGDNEMISIPEAVSAIVDQMVGDTDVIPGEEKIPGSDFELEQDYFDPAKQDEKLWQARTSLNNDTLCGAIETIIFMSDRPVPLLKIKKMIDEDMPLHVIHQAIQRLQSEYENSHHGLRLQEVAEGFQFRTKATYSKYVQDLFKVNALVLTPSALEVLTIIAYKQPVSKTEIDKIRGVDSAHLVRALMDKRLVKIVGRSEEVGRPTVFATTQEFLEVFNLSNIQELPPEHELKDIAYSSDVGKISDIRQICSEGDKARFVFDELSELDALTEAIKGIASETDFTRTLGQEEKRRIEAVEKGLNPEALTSGENVVLAKPKTAFEILEEYIERQKIVDQNKKAVSSGPVGVVDEPKIIEDLMAGPFNVPGEVEEEFEMIDLETGLPISSMAASEGQSESEGNQGQNEVEELIANEDSVFLDEHLVIEKAGDDIDQPVELFKESEIIEDLEKAFSNFGNGSKVLAEEAEFNINEAENFFNDSNKRLDQITERILAQGQNLDIDLEFLKEQEGSDSRKEDISDEEDEDKA